MKRKLALAGLIAAALAPFHAHAQDAASVLPTYLEMSGIVPDATYDPFTSPVPRRRPGHPIEERPEYKEINPDAVNPAPVDLVGAFVPLPDRWRIMETLGQKYPWYDPYNNNVYKGDKPIRDGEWFLELIGIADTIAEPRSIPTPTGITSSDHPGQNDIFSGINQTIFAQTLLIGADYYKGDTTFKPPEIEFKVTLGLQYNRVDTDDVRTLQIDPRHGTARDDGFVALQEIFVDKHLRNVSDRFDFDSLRIGIQPFSSDFRGFLFQDVQLGARLFGNRDNNRWQYNIAYFRLLEKDSNSGLNDVTETPRHSDVIALNVYRQDFPILGFTSQATIVYNHDRETSQFYNSNGGIERPASIGTGGPRKYDVVYPGYNCDGHLGRVNLTCSFYAAIGNNIGLFTGEHSKIRAGFAAVEASMDFDWVRARLSGAYSSGDRKPFDDRSTGFSAIFENPIFAGADTSYWIRQNIPLIGGGEVALTERNGLIPDLRTSREHGQSNFDNPGLELIGLGGDFDLAPKHRLSANLNELWFDNTKTLELARNQRPIGKRIGTDASVAYIWRPFMTQNIVIRLSAAALIPGEGLKNLYGSSDTYYTVLGNFIFTY